MEIEGGMFDEVMYGLQFLRSASLTSKVFNGKFN